MIWICGKFFCQSKKCSLVYKNIIIIIIIIIKTFVVSHPSSMDIIGLRIPTRNLRDFPIIYVDLSLRLFHSSGVPLQQIQCVVI